MFYYIDNIVFNFINNRRNFCNNSRLFFFNRFIFSNCFINCRWR